jgi:putative hydrolase of the HAD superfamily
MIRVGVCESTTAFIYPILFKICGLHKIPRLNNFIDFYIGSCFVHFRKPDHDIFRIALDISQVPAHEAVYIEDRKMFVNIAQELGIRGIRHTDVDTTRERLAAIGLKE